MNERIRKLAKQAGMSDDKYGMFFADVKHNEDGVDLQMFAELIVRKCLNIMQNCDGDLDFAIFKTKKQFGVEE